VNCVTCRVEHSVCRVCGTPTHWSPVWSFYVNAHGEGKHHCADFLVAEPLERYVQCARCDGHIVILPTGERLEHDGGSHTCRSQAPALPQPAAPRPEAADPAPAPRPAAPPPEKPKPFKSILDRVVNQ